MVAATGCLVREASQVSFSKPVNIVRVDWPFLSPGALLFGSDSPVQSRGSHQCHLVVVEDVALRGANLGIYPG